MPSSEFRHKVVSGARAAEAVKSGDRIWIQEGNATPDLLIQALLGRAPHSSWASSGIVWQPFVVACVGLEASIAATSIAARASRSTQRG